MTEKKDFLSDNKIRRVNKNGVRRSPSSERRATGGQSRPSSGNAQKASSLNRNVRRSSENRNLRTPSDTQRRRPSSTHVSGRHTEKSGRRYSSDSDYSRRNSSTSGKYSSDNNKRNKREKTKFNKGRKNTPPKQKKKNNRLLKKVVSLLLVAVIAFPVFSAVSLAKKMYDAYDPSIVGGVFDSIAHKNKAGITNILLLGSDARDGDKGSRTDAMMIFTIDTVNESLKLTSLARDTYVNVPGHGDTKLTHAYYYGGVELLTETIEENFGLDIDNYALVDFESFMYIIDAVGGVSVDVKESEIKEINKFIPETYKWYKDKKGEMELIDSPGLQLLNGYQALSFSRIRKNDSAFERDRRQRDVMQAMLGGIKSMSALEYPKLLHAVLPYLTTNMRSTDIVSLGISVIKMGGFNIKQFEFPIVNSPHSTEGKYKNAGWVIKFDDESVDILQDFIFNDIEYSE